jgi:uncharacterized BrkB/YihY/UPF0761 family membrane protein
MPVDTDFRKIDTLELNKQSTVVTLGQVGFLSGIAAFISSFAYCIVQILQIAGFLHFPADEILIYGTSLCIVVPFLVQMLAFHYLTLNDKKFWTHSALIFSVIYKEYFI